MSSCLFQQHRWERKENGIEDLKHRGGEIQLHFIQPIECCSGTGCSVWWWWWWWCLRRLNNSVCCVIAFIQQGAALLQASLSRGLSVLSCGTFLRGQRSAGTIENALITFHHVKTGRCTKPERPFNVTTLLLRELFQHLTHFEGSMMEPTVVFNGVVRGPFSIQRLGHRYSCLITAGINSPSS